jgi:hypothetical protein
MNLTVDVFIVIAKERHMKYYKDCENKIVNK